MKILDDLFMWVVDTICRNRLSVLRALIILAWLSLPRYLGP